MATSSTWGSYKKKKPTPYKPAYPKTPAKQNYNTNLQPAKQNYNTNLQPAPKPAQPAFDYKAGKNQPLPQSMSTHTPQQAQPQSIGQRAKEGVKNWFSQTPIGSAITGTERNITFEEAAMSAMPIGKVKFATAATRWTGAQVGNVVRAGAMKKLVPAEVKAITRKAAAKVSNVIRAGDVKRLTKDLTQAVSRWSKPMNVQTAGELAKRKAATQSWYEIFKTETMENAYNLMTSPPEQIMPKLIESAKGTTPKFGEKVINTKTVRLAQGAVNKYVEAKKLSLGSKVAIVITAVGIIGSAIGTTTYSKMQTANEKGDIGTSATIGINMAVKAGEMDIARELRDGLQEVKNFTSNVPVIEYLPVAAEKLEYSLFIADKMIEIGENAEADMSYQEETIAAEEEKQKIKGEEFDRQARITADRQQVQRDWEDMDREDRQKADKEMADYYRESDRLQQLDSLQQQEFWRDYQANKQKYWEEFQKRKEDQAPSKLNMGGLV